MTGGFLRLGFVFLSTKAVYVLHKCNRSKRSYRDGIVPSEALMQGEYLEYTVILRYFFEYFVC